MNVLNIAAYKFIKLENLPLLRALYKEKCLTLGLKGTILLAPEGINLFLAGSKEAIDDMLTFLRKEDKMADLAVKESWSEKQPFTRMLVKLKQQIIPVDAENIEPEAYTGASILPKELKRWYDEGRDFNLLDTRNDYEVRVGTFEKAIDPDIASFRELFDKTEDFSQEVKEKPLVMFCTGGIRCEKASVVLERQGFKNVYQLDGGILKYFEECGGEHYQGDCFVFDQRVALNSDLEETNIVQCFVCQNPLSEAEQALPDYVPSVSCSYCKGSPMKKRQAFEVSEHANSGS